MKKFFVLIAAMALFAAACGGGDDDGDSADGGSGTLTTEEWCIYNAQVVDLNVFGPTGVLTEDGISGFLKIVDDVEDRAPAEIQDDIAVMGEFMAEFDEVLAEVDYDLTQLTEEDVADLDTTAAEAASDNISAYADANCDVPADDVDDADDGSVPSDGSDEGNSDDGDVEVDEDDTIREIVVDALVSSGMTDEQANCVADELDYDDFLSGAFNPFDFVETFEGCGVDLESLG